MPNYSKFSIDYDPRWSDWDRPVAVPVTKLDRVKIIGGDEKVILAHTITIEYDYPLSVKVRFTHTRKGGWTRNALARAIQKDYKRIYREEDAGVGKPTGNIPGMLNRDFSDGPYGIWGHDIGDLVVECVNYSVKKRLVRLDIGS